MERCGSTTPTIPQSGEENCYVTPAYQGPQGDKEAWLHNHCSITFLVADRGMCMLRVNASD